MVDDIMSMGHWWSSVRNYAVFYYCALLKYTYYWVYMQSMCVMDHLENLKGNSDCTILALHAVFGLFTERKMLLGTPTPMLHTVMSQKAVCLF